MSAQLINNFHVWFNSDVTEYYFLIDIIGKTCVGVGAIGLPKYNWIFRSIASD